MIKHETQTNITYIVFIFLFRIICLIQDVFIQNLSFFSSICNINAFYYDVDIDFKSVECIIAQE